MIETLNIGAGNKIIAGAVNHDLTKHRPEIDVVWDLNDLPWPWEDNSFDKINATAVLEHLRMDLMMSLNECWRILRPGGTIYLKLPHWKHDTSWMDPTHYWKYSLRVLEVFDPDTVYGKAYAFYTEHKWRIIKGPKLNDAKSSFFVTMEVRK